MVEKKQPDYTDEEFRRLFDHLRQKKRRFLTDDFNTIVALELLLGLLKAVCGEKKTTMYTIWVHLKPPEFFFRLIFQDKFFMSGFRSCVVHFLKILFLIFVGAIL